MVALVVVWREECEFSHALLCPLTHLHVVLLLRFIQSALIVHISILIEAQQFTSTV